MKKLDATMVVLSPDMLSKMDDSMLDSILIIYEVDTEKASKIQKLTPQYKCKLILDAQKRAIAAKKGTPKGLSTIIRDYARDFSKVTVNIGYTINMGNYNSLKVEAGITVPVHADEVDFTQATITYKKGVEHLKKAIEKEIFDLKRHFNEEARNA
jgi:hypothetical protein